MKWTQTFLVVLLCACTHAVKLRTVDSESRAPINGVTVYSQENGYNLLTGKQTEIRQIFQTDQNGIASIRTSQKLTHRLIFEHPSHKTNYSLLDKNFIRMSETPEPNSGEFIIRGGTILTPTRGVFEVPLTPKDRKNLQ